MSQRWEGYRAENGGKVPLSEAGREKIRLTARRTMRLRHRKREALEWADWLIEKNTDWSICLWSDRRREILLAPFITAIKSGGMEELCELAGLIDLDLGALPSGAELTGVILGKYAPRFDLRELAADFRRGAGIRISQAP